MNRIDPYNDNKMNYIDGMYYLTLEFVKNAFNNNGIRDDGVLAARIEKNSDKIYDVIYDRSHQANRQVIDYVLHHTEEGRKWLLRLLKAEMEADLLYAYNSLSSLPAINAATGQVIDRNEIFRNEISVETERVLDNSNRYIGFNLTVQFPLQVRF